MTGRHMLVSERKTINGSRSYLGSNGGSFFSMVIATPQSPFRAHSGILSVLRAAMWAVRSIHTITHKEPGNENQAVRRLFFSLSCSFIIKD